jgi:hypothetical protein
LHGVWYGCETWALILRDVDTLRIFENRVLKRIFETKRDKVIGGWENYIMKSFVTYTLRHV